MAQPAGGEPSAHPAGGEPSVHLSSSAIQVGPRPYFLIDDMAEGALRRQLQSCANGPFRRTAFSIGHRGAPLQFPEHTQESYLAAARMGAGVLECDVTFTRDRQLVCRHSQCDLHATTNILAVPHLAAKCSQPFTPADPVAGTQASARCCASDITLAEFKSLRGRMEGFDPKATTVDEYLRGTPGWRTQLYASGGTLLSHRESIELFRQLGVKMSPELKSPEVAMPYEGDFTRERYAQQLVDEYRAAGIPAADVMLQSFDLYDLRYWLAREPAFGRGAIWLDPLTSPDQYPSRETLQRLREEGVRTIAPPLWALLAVGADGDPVPSRYARDARAVGLELITWSLERSPPLSEGGGWYYQTVEEVLKRDGDLMRVLDVLAREVGVKGVFSDWPGTVTYYANCMGLD